MEHSPTVILRDHVHGGGGFRGHRVTLSVAATLHSSTILSLCPLWPCAQPPRPHDRPHCHFYGKHSSHERPAQPGQWAQRSLRLSVTSSAAAAPIIPRPPPPTPRPRTALSGRRTPRSCAWGLVDGSNGCPRRRHHAIPSARPSPQRRLPWPSTRLHLRRRVRGGGIPPRPAATSPRRRLPRPSTECVPRGRPRSLSVARLRRTPWRRLPRPRSPTALHGLVCCDVPGGGRPCGLVHGDVPRSRWLVRSGGPSETSPTPPTDTAGAAPPPASARCSDAARGVGCGMWDVGFEA